MDVELHELGPVAALQAGQDDERIGLALLELLAVGADSPSPWVNRRVAQLEFIDTRAVRWLISVDFTVAETAPLMGSAPRLLLPITRWRKSGTVTVDFRDEQGAAIPLITAEETICFMTAALYRWAAVILQGKGLDEPEQMFAEVRKIVSEPPDRDLIPEGQAADVTVRALLKAVSGGNSDVSDALFANKGFRSNLYELSENFVVLASVESSAGTRRVLTLAFESRVDFQPQANWVSKVLQRLGWRDWPMQVMLGGRGGSCLLEVAAPPGVDIFKIIAKPNFGADPQKATSGPEAITTFGKTPHVSVRVPAVPRRYRATIYLRVNGSGWLTASWLVALVIATSMIVGRSQFAELFSKGASGEAGTAATLLLALLGVFASYLIRPGEHPLAAMLLRSARGLIMIDVGVVLVAVGDLLLHSGPHQPKGLWDSLAWASGTVAVLLSLSRLSPSWPWGKVPTEEASHGGCDDTSEEGEGAAPIPEGVQLHAPDGTSYGDTETWGRRDQRELVDELRRVRRRGQVEPRSVRAKDLDLPK
jgi:hypothetical protein